MKNKKIKIGDIIKLKTYELRGDAEIIGIYKDAYGLDILRIRMESDRLGGYNYYEIYNDYK